MVECGKKQREEGRVKLLQKLKKLAGRLDERLSADLGRTEQGVYWLAMGALSLAGAAGALHTGLHPALAFPLGLLLSFLAANLALLLGCLLLKLLLPPPLLLQLLLLLRNIPKKKFPVSAKSSPTTCTNPSLIWLSLPSTVLLMPPRSLRCASR